MYLLPSIAKSAPLQTNVIHHGEALTILKCLPDGCVNCIVTSPPYYGLRSYVDNDSPLKPSEIGLEDTPEAYIERLVRVFREARRVLADDGTFWLNLGDSYFNSSSIVGGGASPKSTLLGGGGKYRLGSKNEAMYQSAIKIDRSLQDTYKPKDLMFIPHRVAMALQADGWYVRQDIVWNKPNCMPESVTDRPTRSHEYVFLLSKSERYHYDADAIRDPHIWANDKRNDGQRHTYAEDAKYFDQLDVRSVKTNAVSFHVKGKNRRSVWTITTEPFAGAHFAVMPSKLVGDCIAAGSRAGDVVYDPFSGSGTVGLVAMRLGRRYIGSELNREYVEMARQRIAKADPLQPTTLETGETQLSLFGDKSA